jgi:hypothetical protein
MGIGMDVPDLGRQLDLVLAAVRDCDVEPATSSGSQAGPPIHRSRHQIGGVLSGTVYQGRV